MSRKQQFELLNTAAFQKIAESENVQARSFYHAAWGQYFHQTERIEESIAEIQKIIELYDGKKGLQQEHPDMLGNMLHNLLGRYYLLHQIEPIRDLIEKLRTELIYQGNKIKRFETFSLFGMLYASKIGQNLKGSVWQGVLDQFKKNSIKWRPASGPATAKKELTTTW
jgi:hypothetical protein